MGIRDLLKGVDADIAAHVAALYERKLAGPKLTGVTPEQMAEARLALLQTKRKAGKLTHVDELWFSEKS